MHSHHVVGVRPPEGSGFARSQRMRRAFAAFLAALLVGPLWMQALVPQAFAITLGVVQSEIHQTLVRLGLSSGLATPGTSGNVLTSNGTTWVSATPATGDDVSDINEDVKLRSDHTINWSNSVNNVTTLDVGLARNSAGALRVTNGGAGKGSLAVSSLQSDGNVFGSSGSFGNNVILPDSGTYFWNDGTGVKREATGHVSITAGTDVPNAVLAVNNVAPVDSSTALSLRGSSGASTAKVDTSVVIQGGASLAWVSTSTPAMHVGVPFIWIRDEQNQNTAGPSFVAANGFQAARLNTVKWADGNYASLNTTTYTITLQPGTYDFQTSQPYRLSNAVQSRWRNLTTGTTVANSTSNASGGTDGASLVLRGRFRITAETQFAHQVSCNTNFTQGASNLSTEVYAEVLLWRLGD